MKLKFDENISVRIVTAIRSLETGSIEIGSVHEDYSQGITDPDWMFRFRDEGGVAMISGDHNILRTPTNLAAYTASGLVSIWPPGGWPELKRFGQAAFLIRWWAAIKRKIDQSTPGDRWRLPLTWTPGEEKMLIIHDPRASAPPKPPERR